MSDVRDRSHRLNRVDGIARHGRLRRRGPFGTVAKVLSGVVAVALVSSASVAAIAAKQVSDDLGDGVEIEGQPAPHRQGGTTSLSAFEGGFNMLVVGTDNDPEQSAEFGERDATLNDVNILLHVSADHSNATAVSIPRDLVTPIPACRRTDGSTAPAMAAQPINTAFGDGGLNCVTQTVQGLTGLDIQYSAAVSFNGVIEMSNAIGGVPVCVAQPIQDEYTGLNLPAGTSTLQGDEALAFLRTRHGVGDGSDLGRISSQQVFLSSLLRTVKSSGTLTSPTKLYKLARAAASNMQLSESLNDVGTMVQMGRALQDLPLSQVNFVQYPGSTGGTGVYAGKVQPTTYLADQLFAKIKADQSFTLGAGSTGIGSEANAASPSAAASSPAAAPSAAAPPAAAPSVGASSPAAAAPSTPAAASGSGSASASASPETIDGLEGQSADQQTCSKAFGY
ncbi:LCP family protein [Curtobacterium sp. PhB115]|uniref:LCP family protein n=1 Tax=Curtobacterium sp. PhB115 TaxID=2485173 RepID=UPI000F4CEC6B|nr:LCP family protein [Curtobacterium sp. PhB115]ROP61306.1 LytR family transcriptional attenuator [Curtobacterium sp. PhB115]